MTTATLAMVPLLIVVGTLGIVIGMYISSQIETHIDNNIKNPSNGSKFKVKDENEESWN